ncbi:N-acetylmuramidase domain-containing protein [Allomesorhizobium alhagi]|uniref:Peptidoglycan-binding domain 1 protein n=1 Tax=Mesorhizobium alhagi CCNWXJ12-2 TaxID=1107882 RepID=H0I409_9HYPH|nr:N-acetylmuramidase domain-containing protein [Mesorhizobium alhagi]EHK52285.1 peptidoglycan-binding domain 1 protein [Mesorhizobium alhagi CCNWXJ12-2]
MLGTGRAERLPEGAIENLAYRLDVHPADLQAIANVESGGSAWFPDGRLKILYERNIFYTQLPAAKRAAAVAQGLAHKGHRGRSQYADQKSAESRFDLLQRAIHINRDAAFNAISSGRFQIMGFNAGLCSYPSAEAMFEAFADSELAQLSAFAAFLEKKGLVPAIRSRDFDRVGRVYNGDKTGVYAGKMRREAEALRGRRWLQPHQVADIPLGHGPRSEAGSDMMQTVSLGARGEEVRMLQSALKLLGYPVGKVDGIFGELTRAAVLEFQAVNDIATTGVLDTATWAVLAKSPRRAMAVDRATATEEDLLTQGSETIRTARNGRRAGILASVLGGLGFLGGPLDVFDGLQGRATTIAEGLPGNAVEQGDAATGIFGSLVQIVPAILGTGPSGMWLPLLGFGLYSIYANRKIVDRRLEDHRTGADRGR